MSDGQWIERGTLDYGNDRDTEQRRRIHELEAELETCRKYRDAYRQCDEIATADVRRLEAENARLTATVEAYEHMKAQMDADGGPGVMRRQMQLRRYRIRAERAEADLAALREGRGVKIKPLEWDQYEEARCLGLAWNVYEVSRPGQYNVTRCAPDHERLGTKVTQDEAFALAQADCDRLILSALSPAPVSVGDKSEDHCAKCGAPRSNHPYRHPFVPRALAETEKD